MQSSKDYEVVTSYLNSLNIHYSDDWVLKCIDCVKSSRPLLSANDLCSAVYQNWLSVDLREVKAASLPAHLSSQDKITLTGTYAVQVESMVNSSKSSYSELCRIQKSDKIVQNPEELTGEEESESKRCLVFVFCDGVHEIQGLEYQCIPSFRLNDPGFLPGIKILIVGPVMCRKGMLLLKKENVKIYGGKVERLCQTNNLESLLCKKLGLNLDLDKKENKPDQADVADVNVNSSEIQSDVPASSFSRSEINDVTETDGVDELLSEDDDILVSLTLDSDNFNECSENSLRETRASKASTSGWEQKVTVSSNILACENGNQSSNFKLTSNASKKSLRQEKISDFGKSKKPRLSQNDSNNEDLTWQSVSSPSNNSESEKVNVAKSKGDVGRKNFQMNITSFLPTMKMGNCQLDNSVNKDGKKFPLIVSSYPFIYLKQTVGIILSEPVIFIVKAIILTLKSKISMKDDEFALKAVISDGSYAIQVNFSSDILENIMEYSPCEINSFMSEKNRNSAVGEKLKTIFFSAQQKLLSMNCLMEVKFFSDGQTPLIIGLEEIQQHHVNALKSRMS